ncbi:TPA: hypothetical protein ACGW3S_005883 [Pseudomonas aeruginosa]|uniref:hypothetical protein n=1 Tax=Pseudomonas aeruginosa TaxID=287 RepID=UPI000D022C68|nr:hypothetical protein [Pseudomonas aeruginosa]
MTESKICTCPSGDGSLRWPCPAHPAEQAGGDERASKPGLFCRDCGSRLMVRGVCSIYCPNCVKAQARAALAQPSPAPELERPEVVGYLATAEHPKHGQPHKAFNYFKDQHDAQVAHWRERGCTVTEDRLMTVSQHERIVGALRADRDSWAEQAEQRLADWDEMRKERDAALARVEELERQEPVALANRGLHAFWVKWTEAAAGLYGPGIKLYAAPVAQAQQLNDLDKQCRDDVARALGLRPNQERGFAWSYLLASIKSCVKASGDSAKAQHSVPEGWMLVPVEPLLNMMSDKDHDTRITAERQLLSILAAAPGKEVGHE